MFRFLPVTQKQNTVLYTMDGLVKRNLHLKVTDCLSEYTCYLRHAYKTLLHTESCKKGYFFSLHEKIKSIIYHWKTTESLRREKTKSIDKLLKCEYYKSKSIIIVLLYLKYKTKTMFRNVIIVNMLLREYMVTITTR